MAVPVRCKKCDKRQTINRRPDDYKVMPAHVRRCFNCGATGYFRGDSPFRVDEYRIKKEYGVKPCNCDNWPFPHRVGTKFCRHYAGKISAKEWQQHGEKLTAAYSPSR